MESNAPSASDILKNYHHQRHFLQIVHMPAFEPPVRTFLYMKNHKCACSTVIATLLHRLNAQAGGSMQIDMKSIHNPPKSLIKTGRKALDVPSAIEALEERTRFCFSVVRHPTARTLSAFFGYLLKTPGQKEKFLRHVGREPDGDLGLSDFLDIIAHDETARDLNRHWRPQRKEISFDFIDFDFIGRVDDLNTAVEHISYEIFGNQTEMQDTRSSLGHSSSSKDAIQSLTRTDHMNLESAFSMDFEMFENVKTRFS